MPAGSRGKSAKVRYTTDGGINIVLKVPQYIIDGGGHGLQPTDGTEQARPDGLRPRVVFWEGEITEGEGATATTRKIRRSIPCNPGSLLITAEARQGRTLDGVEGVTTGRRGERRSY